MDDSWDGRRLLLVGTYTPDSDPSGEGEGVYRVWFDPITGHMADGGVAARTPGPSFLAFHADPPTVYAVNERAEGTVTAFRVDGRAELTELGRAATGGGSPCHVLARGSELVVTNYANGVAAVYGLGGDGAFAAGPVELAHTGSGPVTERQEGPHAHSAAAPDDRHVLVADLGTDELRVLRGDAQAGAVALPPGTGPRHAAVAGEYVYVAGELDSRVHVVRWDAREGAGEHLGSVHATGEEAAGDNFPAEILVHGGCVYVSNRGADSIATLAVRDGGARLEHVADTPAGGAWPRNFTVVRGHREEPDHLVVAAQNGDSLASLRIDPDTGVPADTGHRLDVPVPVCVLPVPITRIRRAEAARG
ncbi:MULTISPECIES: lactonase family protein [unclassified Nocardiopsis]|uniref:lactonase family protein n=1 Tax=unclassified Nocardiopsis TaxID=2649073 RepID=UPI001356FE79|nr:MULTISPECIES: lactonase family protein [unclassified Nocardiopsis]